MVWKLFINNIFIKRSNAPIETILAASPSPHPVLLSNYLRDLIKCVVSSHKTFLENSKNGRFLQIFRMVPRVRHGAFPLLSSRCIEPPSPNLHILATRIGMTFLVNLRQSNPKTTFRKFSRRPKRRRTWSRRKPKRPKKMPRTKICSTYKRCQK